MPKLSLVLPVLNEVDIISPVVSKLCHVLKEAQIDYELILVENESQDNTWTVLKSLSEKYERIIVKKSKRGYGRAILAGLRIASGKYVGYMPSDGQVNPRVIPQLFSLITKGEVNLVGINRVLRENFFRKFRSKIFNLLAKIIFNPNSKDINGDPKIFPRKELKRLKLQSKDSFLSLELLIKAKYLGWKIKEIPVTSLPRAGGKSTVNIMTVLEFLKNMLMWKFGGRLKKWLLGPIFSIHFLPTP